MQVSVKDPVIKAIISDMSKMSFKIEGLEKQISELGIDKIAAAPQEVPTPPEKLPGMSDMDQFKPKGFEGKAEGAAPADKTPEDIKKKAKNLFDEIEITEKQFEELKKMDDEEDDDEDDDEDKSICYFCHKRIFGYSKQKGHWDIEPHSKEWFKGTSIRVHTLCLNERQVQRNHEKKTT